MLSNKKVLIIRLSAIGDTIHTLPMIAAIKTTYPDCEIGWVVESKAKMFVENNPLVDKCFVINKKRDNFFKIIKEIRQEKYDYALDPQQLFKSGIILGLCGAKKRITLSGGREFSWIFANKIIKAKRKLFDINYHVVKRNLELCEYLGCNTENITFPTPSLSDEEKKEIEKLIQKSDKPLVAIAPATTWINKHLPNEFWVEIADYLEGKADVIYTGSKKDEKLINHIIEKSKNKAVKSIAGETDLLELKEIFSKCKLVITPDSGSAHIAWAAKNPAILSFFSATSARRTAPFGEDKYISIQSKAFCSPCMKKKCTNKFVKHQCTQEFCAENIKKQIDLLLKQIF